MTAGVITSSDGFAYRLTADDLDWASRLLGNEGGSMSADLWTMAQRFVLLHRSFPTFAAMLRAFSQPINPRWLASGDFCAPGGRYAGTPNCSPDKLARRAYAQAPSTSYPAKMLIVRAWANGMIANPVPRATDFRANDDTAHSIASSGRMRLVLDDGNWYFATSDTDHWDPNHVLVGGRGTESSIWTSVAIGAGVAFAAGVVVWVAAEEYAR
jgi:hypothetical protein